MKSWRGAKFAKGERFTVSGAELNGEAISSNGIALPLSRSRKFNNPLDAGWSIDVTYTGVRYRLLDTEGSLSASSE